MLPLEKQCCSLEYCKKLKELGVTQDSYFYWQTVPYGTILLTRYDYFNSELQGYSAFTTAELGVMFPLSIPGYPHNQQYKDDHDSFVCLYTTDDQLKEACFQADTEANARAKALVSLIENNFITVSEINERI
jgi:hypothetical protein